MIYHTLFFLTLLFFILCISLYLLFSFLFLYFLHSSLFFRCFLSCYFSHLFLLTPYSCLFLYCAQLRPFYIAYRIIFTGLPLNYFWPSVGVLTRPPTSLLAAQPSPLPCTRYGTFHSQTKEFCFISLLSVAFPSR